MVVHEFSRGSRQFYSGSNCSWATFAASTFERGKEGIETLGTAVSGRRRVEGPMSLHTAIGIRSKV